MPQFCCSVVELAVVSFVDGLSDLPLDELGDPASCDSDNNCDVRRDATAHRQTYLYCDAHADDCEEYLDEKFVHVKPPCVLNR